jgi:hypothetical protein
MIPLFIAAMALIVSLVGLPMALDKVPPNRFYGFRTPRTIADERVWYPANRVAGKALVVAGLLGALASAPVGFLVQDPNMAAVYALLAMCVPLTIAILYGFYRAAAVVADLDFGPAEQIEQEPPAATEIAETPDDGLERLNRAAQAHQSQTNNKG